MFPPQIQRVIDQVDRLRETVDDHWQIPRDEAALLAQLVRLGRCVSICEIGASYGFSTLHLAAAALENGGRVHSLEHDPKKVAATNKHLGEAGLADVATVYPGDARATLKGMNPGSSFDFVFIDAQKSQSFDYLEAIWPLLAPTATLVTDNTTTHADELASFVAHLRSRPGVRSCHVPVGNGFELTIRRTELLG
ncbi:Predicted O-methyltransferase YrrM [Singulisphaera sp. GP187]|uniref:O-methyltransferase n=1 Tax=Singulisphaera sp. GP187 TaxID=1882752 RepID=UPI00092711D0|nr:class I SAM-dependent methyltransferase [Singulisphaera sp. GP187]SIO66011.1 Predicted O-methyltransferase YrrM [Singulisphaera sp. GP187]